MAAIIFRHDVRHTNRRVLKSAKGQALVVWGEPSRMARVFFLKGEPIKTARIFGKVSR